MWLRMFWIPVVQSSDHVGDSLVIDQGLKASDDASPACIATSKALWPEQGLVEAQTTYDRPENTVYLIVWFESSNKVLEERVKF